MLEVIGKERKEIIAQAGKAAEAGSLWIWRRRNDKNKPEVRDVNPQATQPIDTLTMEESAQQRHNSQGCTCFLCHCDEHATLCTGCPRRLSQHRSDVTAFKGKGDTLSRVRSACKAKRMAKILSKGGGWEARRVDVMRHIIKAKAAAVPKYRAELLAAKETIVEAVHGDLYWSCGLSKEDVRWAETRDWPGENTMGKLHMELRESLRTS